MPLTDAVQVSEQNIFPQYIQYKGKEAVYFHMGQSSKIEVKFSKHCGNETRKFTIATTAPGCYILPRSSQTI